jgi:hypothetical protein
MAINAKMRKLLRKAIIMIRTVIRSAVAAVLLTAVLPSAPSFAVSAKDKMATCQFGADDQKLEGAARKAFMAKCMANRNDPRGKPAGGPAAGTMGPGAPPPAKN